MSSPIIIRCKKCGNSFLFLRNCLEKCTTCGEEYISHRDEKTEKREQSAKERKPLGIWFLEENLKRGREIEIPALKIKIKNKNGKRR